MLPQPFHYRDGNRLSRSCPLWSRSSCPVCWQSQVPRPGCLWQSPLGRPGACSTPGPPPYSQVGGMPPLSVLLEVLLQPLSRGFPRVPRRPLVWHRVPGPSGRCAGVMEGAGQDPRKPRPTTSAPGTPRSSAPHPKRRLGLPADPRLWHPRKRCEEGTRSWDGSNDIS